jgi:hypothetical protein
MERKKMERKKVNRSNRTKAVEFVYGTLLKSIGEDELDRLDETEGTSGGYLLVRPLPPPAVEHPVVKLYDSDLVNPFEGVLGEVTIIARDPVMVAAFEIYDEWIFGTELVIGSSRKKGGDVWSSRVGWDICCKRAARQLVDANGFGEGVGGPSGLLLEEESE